MSEPTIEDYYVEERTFPPSAEFSAAALLGELGFEEFLESKAILGARA